MAGRQYDTSYTIGAIDDTAIGIKSAMANLNGLKWQFATILAPVTIVGGAIFGFAKKAANAGEELEQLNSITGISVEELYSLKKIAELARTDIYTLGRSLGILSNNLIEAKDKTSEAYRIFKALGINTAQPLIKIFMDLSKELATYEDGADKINLVNELTGRSWRELSLIMKELNERGLELSDTFTEKNVKAAKEFNDNITILKQNISDLTYQIGNNAIPVFNNFFKIFKSDTPFLEFAKRFARDTSVFNKGISELSGLGVTKLQDLPFMFDNGAFFPKKPVPEFLKDESEKRAKEEQRTAKDIADTYKDMYSALKFDTEKYYTFQKGLLEKRREEEIKVTGDITLAWDAYYARLQELEEARILRSNDFLGGIRVYFSELNREGTTWAVGAKDMMQDFQSATASGFRSFYKNLHEEHQKFGDAMLNSVLDWIQSMIDALNKFASEQAAASLFAMFGQMFISAAGSGFASASNPVSGVEGTVPATGLDFGGASPSLSAPMRTSNNESPVIVNQSINYNFALPIDGYSFKNYLKRDANTIRAIHAEGIRQSRNYAKQVRGNKG